MPRIPTHTPDWSNPRPGDPGHTLKGRRGVPVIDVPHLDLSRKGSIPKPLVVDVPRGTLKLGQRLAAITLRDAKGRTAMIELTHVVQQRPSTRRSSDPLPTESVTISYSKVE